jgi:hypothetical protein
MRKFARLGVAGLMAATLVATASPAFASGGDKEVVKRGDCSMASDWKLRIRTDGSSRLDLEWEAGEVAGQTWQISMNYNGTKVFSGQRTAGADGEFDVDREVANKAGADTLTGSAKNLQTGETCNGSVTADF